MTDLTQRARDLVEKLIDCIEVDLDLVNESSRVEIKGADEMILALLSDVRRESAAELSAIKRALGIEDDNDSPVSDIERLLAENERLREIVLPLAKFFTMLGDMSETDDGFDGHISDKMIACGLRESMNTHREFTRLTEIGQDARDAARQTLDRDLTDK